MLAPITYFKAWISLNPQGKKKKEEEAGRNPTLCVIQFSSSHQVEERLKIELKLSHRKIKTVIYFLHI